MSEGRYRLSGHFGAMSASNNTSACTECGVVVWDEKIHDAKFHPETPQEPHPECGAKYYVHQPHKILLPGASDRESSVWEDCPGWLIK